MPYSYTKLRSNPPGGLKNFVNSWCAQNWAQNYQCGCEQPYFTLKKLYTEVGIQIDKLSLIWIKNYVVLIGLSAGPC